MPHIPTSVAQAHAAMLDAWAMADSLWGRRDTALYMQALQAAVILDELYTLRYARWQQAGGQSDWSPIDKYLPDEEQWPSSATRYEILGGVQ